MQGIEPGTLTERLLIEAPSVAVSTSGSRTTTWAPIARGASGVVSGRKLTERGVEVFAGHALLGKVEIGFAIRWWASHGLTPQHRFTWRGTVYSIVAVIESQPKVELILLATAGLNRG